ncbi:MAG TPA: PAS domain S-box protein [Pirellulales bacterium]|nr:PAS domain S-box protein [Pirellulales bacterium]
MARELASPDELQQEVQSLQGRLAELQRELVECRRSEIKFRLAAEALPTAMVVVNGAGQIVLVNAQTESVFGYSRSELLGQDVELLVPASFRDKHPQLRKGFFARPAARAMGAGRDLYGRRKDGSEFPVEIGLTPIEAEEGLLVLSAIVDITERKAAEAVIRSLNADLEQRVRNRTAQLEAANRELEAFSYSVSHDLRAPLRAIDGFSRILLNEYQDAMPAEAQCYLRDVRANTQQMGRLVDDLLAFSRLGRQQVNRERVAVAGLVRACLEELREQQAGRRVELLVGELSACSGDPALLKQVWLNLLSNALKFTAHRQLAVIEIASHPVDGANTGSRQVQNQPIAGVGLQNRGAPSAGELTYSVKDNGVGFDMRYAQKLFGVFQRLHRAEDYEGTGVGLAIVQRIVHRHGGRVWAEAEPGVGATFSFTLPSEGAVGESRPN